MRERNREVDKCFWNNWARNENKTKQNTRLRRPNNISKKWMACDEMHKAVTCESLWEFPRAKIKNDWEKEVPCVSHQGVLWAQEPWLLLGMDWEWLGEEESEDCGSGVCYWVGAIALHVISTSDIIHEAQDSGTANECHLNAICCKTEREGQQESIELFPVRVSILWAEYDLGTKDRRQK